MSNKKEIINWALQSKNFGIVEESIKDLNYYKDFVARKKNSSNWKEHVEKLSTPHGATLLLSDLEVAAEMFAFNEVNKNTELWKNEPNVAILQNALRLLTTEQILTLIIDLEDRLPQEYKVHPKVIAFAKDMHKELKANEPTKGTSWQEWGDVPKMLEELSYHEIKLNDAFIADDKDRIREHLADCGNFLMFIGNAYFLYE